MKMPNPKSITFIDTSKDVKKALEGLSKTALRASGKVIRKILRSDIPVRYNRLKNHIASWAFIDRSTGQPQLQIGFYSRGRVKSKGKKPSHANPHWIETGVRPHVINSKRAKAMAFNDDFYGKSLKHPGTRGTNVLRNSVYNNIAEIRDAQEEYLAALSAEIEQAIAKIEESEEAEDD